MMLRRAWVLNYGAEAELAGRSQGKLAFSGRPDWVGGEDVVIGAGATTLIQGAAELHGAAWCPTSGALEALRRAGVKRLPVAPSQDVLRRANARSEFADLHPLESLGAKIASTVRELEALVACAAPRRPSGRAPAWLLRTDLCASGQGRRLVERWDDATVAWSHRALAVGAVHVLPVVDVVEEFSCHAFLWSSGEVSLGQHVLQSVTGGAWRAAVPRREQIDALNRVRDQVIARLRSFGYFGPVGVDGFLWRDAEEAEHVAAGTDVNARYTMSMGAAFAEVPLESCAV
ncbi:MAG: hypothetical protein ACJA2W_003705 [Planctomycetota bacterium]|jgi:hypothetical protein